MVKAKLLSLLTKINPLRIQWDIRLFLFFGGLAILWHGVNLILPWLSYVILGFVFMLLGWFLQEDKR
jgi:hypothetical protein